MTMNGIRVEFICCPMVGAHFMQIGMVIGWFLCLVAGLNRAGKVRYFGQWQEIHRMLFEFPIGVCGAAIYTC